MSNSPRHSSNTSSMYDGGNVSSNIACSAAPARVNAAPRPTPNCVAPAALSAGNDGTAAGDCVILRESKLFAVDRRGERQRNGARQQRPAAGAARPAAHEAMSAHATTSPTQTHGLFDDADELDAESERKSVERAASSAGSVT